MDGFSLIDGLYLAPTPAGAYYAVSDSREDKARTVLRNVMRQREARPLDEFWLQRLFGEPGAAAASILADLQDRGYVQGMERAWGPPSGPLDEVIPPLLAGLSLPGDSVLLADDHGLALASHGFDERQAEALAGVSASLGVLHARHGGLFDRELGVSSSAWALVGAGGNSEVGFWPLYIGSSRFVLVIKGFPNLNRPELVDLIWALNRRYAVN